MLLLEQIVQFFDKYQLSGIIVENKGMCVV